MLVGDDYCRGQIISGGTLLVKDLVLKTKTVALEGGSKFPFTTKFLSLQFTRAE